MSSMNLLQVLIAESFSENPNSVSTGEGNFSLWTILLNFKVQISRVFPDHSENSGGAQIATLRLLTVLGPRLILWLV
jgi:hypothetical protein